MASIVLDVNEILVGGVQGQAALDDLLNGLQVSLSGGDGINVSSGGEVSVELAALSGLAFDSGRLVIDIEPNRGLELIGGDLALKQAASVSSPSGPSLSTVTISSADASVQTASYVEADVQSIATLANELKGDVTALVSDHNALVGVVTTIANALAAIITNLKTAEHMEP